MNLPYYKLAKLASRTYALRNLLALACYILVRILHPRIVLVVGMSRSGTTFLSKILSLNHSSHYVNEPVKFLLQAKLKQEHRATEFPGTKFWSQYVSSEKILPFKFHAFIIIVLYILLKIKPSNTDDSCIIIKPIATIELYESLAHLLKASVVFISRHPCARSASIVRQRKLHGLELVKLEQMESLGSYWGSIHKQAIEIFKRNQEWIWVKFEELCIEPIRLSQEIFDQLGFQWSTDIQSAILTMTNSDSDEFYGVNRISKKQVDKWQFELSKAQIEGIRKGSLLYETKLYEGF